MTKCRIPGSLDHAVHRAIGILGRDGVNVAAGMSPNSSISQQWSDPDSSTWPNGMQMKAIDAACFEKAHEHPFRDWWHDDEDEELPHEVKPALTRLAEFSDTSHATQAGFLKAFETHWSRTDVIRALEAAREHEASLRGLKADLEAMLVERLVGGDRGKVA